MNLLSDKLILLIFFFKDHVDLSQKLQCQYNATKVYTYSLEINDKQ